MKSLSEVTDLLDRDGDKHSNTKVMTFIVIVGELSLWGALKFTGRVLTVTDATFLIALVAATYGARYFIAVLRAKVNGNGNGTSAAH